jgi:hypothetical protein
LSHFQLGILLNPDIIPEGASIKISPVAGSSELLPEQQPGPEKFSFDAINKCIRVVAMVSKTPNVFTTINKAKVGTKLVRIRVTCSQAFNTGVSTNHTWNFSKKTGYESKIFARVGTTSFFFFFITNKASFAKSKSAADITFGK